MKATRRSVLHIGIFMGFLLASADAIGQRAIFSGGSGDGHSKSVYKQSQPLGRELFMGNSGDGYSMDSYTQSVVSGSQPFSGGNGDGYSFTAYQQANPTGTNIYYGGIGDGADESSYEQGLVIAFGVYTGGIGDGHAEANYVQDPVLGADLFRGGNADGHAQISYQQQLTTGFALYGGGLGDGYYMSDFLQQTIASQALFYGGLGDGFDADDFGQSSPIGTDLYVGGAGDGADQDDYEQGVVAVFGVYTGGEGDGYDLAEYQQSDFIDALPVELISFSVVLAVQKVDISWTTASEANNDYFLVERSNDLKHWMTIDSVQGAGNSNSLIVYTSSDRNPKMTINYYRLKQVDYDGTTSYSMIRTVDLNGVKTAAELIVYPNPVRDRINLQFTGFVSSEIQLRIYDANGRQVYEKKLVLPTGQGVYEINRSTKMLKGYYVVIVTDELNGRSMKTRMLVK